MVLTGNSMGIAVKFGIITSCCIENGNFNETLMVFISNFTATHAITSTNTYISYTNKDVAIMLVDKRRVEQMVVVGK